MKKILIMMLSLVILGCAKEETGKQEDLAVFELKGTTPPSDVAGRSHEGVNLYTGPVVDLAFGTKSIEFAGAVDKWEAAVEIFNTNMEGCIQLQFLNVVTENFTETINKGSSFTLEVSPAALAGTNSKYIRTYITKNNVPEAYVSQYGESFTDRVVDGGIIEFTSDNTFQIVYEFPFDLDGIKIKYLDDDGTYIGNQQRAGLESYFYSEYGYKNGELEKLRNERLNLTSFTADFDTPVYSSLGKTWLINGHPSIFTDVIGVREDLELDVFVRTLAYEFGQESAYNSPVNWEALKAQICN